MYYDYEGHAIATSTADAASGMSEHDLAQYFGYDCYCHSCDSDNLGPYGLYDMEPVE
jgi:hypothetical protein